MARVFTDVLRDLGRQQTLDDLTAQLSECVQAVIDTRKQGSLTLNLKIKPNGEDSVIISDEIKAKVPEPSRGETLFFTTSDGGLHRSDPKQTEMPLRSVDAGS